MYSLQILENQERQERKYFKQNLANAIDISNRTLDQYFSILNKEGFIRKKGAKYERPISDLISITPLGLDELKMVDKVVSGIILTPERHNIPSCIPVRSILKRIRDPMEKIFFLSICTRLKRFDLMTFLETMRYAQQDSNLVNVLSDIGEDDSGDRGNYLIETLYKTSLFKEFDEASFLKDVDIKTDIDSILILATAYQRQGRNKDARLLFEIVLSDRARPSQNQWFIAKLGLSRITRSEGDPDKALELLDDIYRQTDNRIFHALITMRKATTLSEMGRLEEAASLFNTALHSCNSFQIPILKCILLNNRGIMYLRMGDPDRAAEDWTRAMKHAKDAGSKFIKGPILTNLSDIQMRNGDLDKASSSLSQARKIFDARNDFEGIAGIEFNMALLYLYLNDVDEANRYFILSEEVAYPAPSPLERMERREVFLITAEELNVPGAKVPDDGIN